MVLSVQLIESGPRTVVSASTIMSWMGLSSSRKRHCWGYRSVLAQSTSGTPRKALPHFFSSRLARLSQPQPPDGDLRHGRPVYH